ncbi:hypothetical protein EDD18DRAFT_1331831 [Armillaria luteobubalina]|uniref:Uncharacterized protein n=1 Tax=Armillaria luteobubalina TaxID=153913 RepID=A0AA39Q636_9AGAR|nr:hypothetical protein EDD18DRAFT_1331831 [Armillaria luteobubalina]
MSRTFNNYIAQSRTFQKTLVVPHAHLDVALNFHYLEWSSDLKTTPKHEVMELRVTPAPSFGSAIISRAVRGAPLPLLTLNLNGQRTAYSGAELWFPDKLGARHHFALRRPASGKICLQVVRHSEFGRFLAIYYTFHPGSRMHVLDCGSEDVAEITYVDVTGLLLAVIIVHFFLLFVFVERDYPSFQLWNFPYEPFARL